MTDKPNETDEPKISISRLMAGVGRSFINRIVETMNDPNEQTESDNIYQIGGTVWLPGMTMPMIIESQDDIDWIRSFQVEADKAQSTVTK